MSHNLTETNQYIPSDVARLMHQPVTPEEYEQLIYKHSDLYLELTSSGELVIMPGTGLKSGVRNAYLTSQLDAWSRYDGSGICADSSTVFALPNGARRIPDAAWIKREKWNQLTNEEKEQFGPFCPDFVVEIMSPSDRLNQQRDKMLEYMETGASLGWLIDPFNRRIYVYRPNKEVVVLDNLETISGDPLLPGFVLNLTELWS